MGFARKPFHRWHSETMLCLCSYSIRSLPPCVPLYTILIKLSKLGKVYNNIDLDL